MKNKKRWWKYLFPVFFIILSGLILFEGSMSGTKSSFQSRTFASLLDFGKEPKAVLPSSLSLEDEYSLYVGERVSLAPLILPENTSDKRVCYEILSGDDIVSLSSGNLSGKKEGQAKVKAECLVDKDVSFTFLVHVMGKKISSLSFELTTKGDLVAGMTSRMKVKSDKPDFSLSDILFTSSDETLATIDRQGCVRTYKPGKVTLGISSKENPDVSFSSVLTIIDGPFYPVSGLSCESEMKTYVGKTLDILPSFNEEASDKTFRILKKKGNVRISENHVTPLSIGEHELEIQSISNPDKKAVVILFAEEVKAKSLLIETSLFRCGETKKIGYTLVSDEEGLSVTYADVSFSCSNDDIASVDAYGYLTGKKKGSVAITLTWKKDPEIKAVQNVSVTVMDTKSFDRLNALMRKLVGHFGSFLVLSVFALFIVIFFFKKGKPRVFSSSFMLLYGFLLAGLSEILQLFTSGRSGSFKDVLIDFSGYVLGFFLSLAVALQVEHRNDPARILTKGLPE